MFNEFKQHNHMTTFVDYSVSFTHGYLIGLGKWSFWMAQIESLCWESIIDSWWRHQMETFSALLAICAGNSPVPVQRPVTRSVDIFFDLPRINGWVNNREAGDLRRHRAHYDVTVMFAQTVPGNIQNHYNQMGVQTLYFLIWGKISYFLS